MASVVDTIPVGPTPQGLVVIGNRLYSASQTNDTVLVVNISTKAVIATVPVGDGPVRRFHFSDRHQLEHRHRDDADGRFGNRSRR